MSKPTFHLRWTDADSRDDVPRASRPGWPECGPSHYKLQQWWAYEEETGGEWRDVEYGNGDEPPDQLTEHELTDNTDPL